jgi:hypothetical protein
MKYEKPALVALHYTNIGHGQCKIGSADLDDCRDGLSALNRCGAGPAELQNQCRDGSSATIQCKAGTGVL